MRMWMVNPKVICNKHLLGEHVELHMLVGSLLKNKSIKGFLEKKLVAPQFIESRHKELIEEMEARGMKHKSELPLFQTEINGEIDTLANTLELIRRCPECKKRLRKLVEGKE